MVHSGAMFSKDESPLPQQVMQPAPGGGTLAIYQFTPAGQPPRGTLLLTHGMGEHAGRYTHVAQRLTQLGLRVCTWDLRGHGRSTGQRGDVPAYDLLTDDLQAVWQIAADGGKGPLFLYAHSTGAQIALNFALKHRPPVAGMIITSPWFRLAFEPPWWKVALARATARLWPTFTQNTELVPARLSRDLEFLKSLPNPELNHHRMSARAYFALTEGGERAAREAIALPYPTLLIHGERDPVTSVQATRIFFDAMQSPDKKLVIIPDAVHETHNDLCRDEVLKQICIWLKSRL
jgi:acylglycerol lipase